MPSLPDVMIVRVETGGRPVPGLFVRLVLRMKHKNDFSLMFGPTGTDGRLSITKDAIHHECESERNLFIMDYSGLDHGFAGEIELSVRVYGDLKRALDAYSMFKRSVSYPTSYEADIRSALDWLAQNDNKDFDIVVESAIPESISVKTVRVQNQV